MRRILCLMCSVLLIMSIAVFANAVGNDDYDELCEEIIVSVKTGERLDVTDYGLTREELQEIYKDLFHRGLLPWFADSYFDWSASSEGIVSTFVPRDLRKRSFDEELYERSMAELIAETCHEGMTPLQMVLSVHDYIVSHAEYRFLDATNNGYHALVKGETACYGYAQLFMRVMDRIGIPCQIVICDDTGDGVGHGWNVVQLDGNWYHIDLTWDDPLYDAPGRALHEHFLKTDSEFKSPSNGHNFDWTPYIGCDDRRYSTGTIWEDLTNPVIFPNADTMILRRNDYSKTAIYSVDTQTGEEILLYSLKWKETRIGDGFTYLICSNGLHCWNEKIWFNTADTVFSMNLDGTGLKEEYIYDTNGNGRFIYGFQIDDGVLTLTVADMENDIREQEVELTGVNYHVHSYESSYSEPTCSQEGYKQYTCSCGVTYYIERKEPLEHEFEQETTDRGTRHYCLNCDYEYEEILPSVEPVEDASEVYEEDKMGSILPFILSIGVAATIVAVITGIQKKRNNV